MFLRAVVGRVGYRSREYGTNCASAAFKINRFNVFCICADIANMGEGEGNDLRSIGRVCENLLIAGHRGIETYLSNRFADRSKAKT